jgi:hypothetical protein
MKREREESGGWVAVQNGGKATNVHSWILAIEEREWMVACRRREQERMELEVTKKSLFRRVGARSKVCGLSARTGA